jgi:hypothetical protein
MSWQAAVAIAIALCLFWGLLALLMRRARREYSEAEAGLADLNALSIESAEESATRAMADWSLFRVVAALTEQPIPRVPEGVQKLFRRYERVEAVAAPAIRLDRGAITPSATHPGYTVIGFGMENSDVEFQILCEDGSERVYEAHPDDPLFPYTSVYHLILDAASEMRQSRRSSSSSRGY